MRGMETKPLKVLDLFCGFGGFSQVFRDRGHHVIGVDNVAPADVIADVQALPFRGYRPDVILGSPPCTEFSRWDMPWKHCPNPSFALVDAFLAAVDELKPRWWVLENVRGLRRLPVMRCGSRYLWGDFPLFLFGSHQQAQGKERLPVTTKDRPRIRSMIPPVISRGLCLAMEASR